MEGAYVVSSPIGQRSSPRLAIAAAFVLGSVITGLVVSSSGGPDREPSPVVRFSVQLPQSRGFSTIEMAISPNDENLALRMGDDIYLRPIGKLDATRLTDEGGPASSPFFSTDGQWLGFFAQGQLKKVAVSGDAAPIVLCDVTGGVFGASWGGDGTIVFAQNPGGIYRVSGSGGEPELLIALNERELGQFPQALPGGTEILLTLRASSSTPLEEAQIVVHSLRTGERRVLIEGGRAGLYASTGHLISNRQETLFAVPFDGWSWDVGRGTVPLIETRPPTHLTSRARNFSISTSGALVFLANNATSNTTPVWLSRNGEERDLRLPPKPYDWLHISPDGTRVVLGVERTIGGADIWMHDFDAPTIRRPNRMTIHGRIERETAGHALRQSFSRNEMGEACSGNAPTVPARGTSDD